MRTHLSSFTVRTREQEEIIDITGLVAKEVSSSGIRDGICLVQSQHTTAGIYVNVTEDLQGDVLDMLARLAPADARYSHNAVDPNAQAHLKKLLVGRSEQFAILDGTLALGTWERVQLAEFDGPREREILVVVLGE